MAVLIDTVLSKQNFDFIVIENMLDNSERSTEIVILEDKTIFISFEVGLVQIYIYIYISTFSGFAIQFEGRRINA